MFLKSKVFFLVLFTDFDSQIGRLIFKSFKKLNRIQSIVFDMAYNTNENLLVAAPTGAGKTNIALLTIGHEIKNNIKEGVLKKDEFKVSSNRLALDIWSWFQRKA